MAGPKVLRLAAFFGVVLIGAQAFGQDSVSKGSCLPGDAVSPWDDAGAANGSEQVNDYIVDMDTFTSSWGNTFGIAPIIKTSKTAGGFFGSLMSSSGISRKQKSNAPFPRATYDLWNTPGAGVNNDASRNDAGAATPPSSATGNQFGVAFSEFSETDAVVDYQGTVGALVNYDPAVPTRLYVSRVMAAANGADDDDNLSQMGFGSIDEDGNLVFRADDFGLTGGLPLTNLAGNNIFCVDIAARNAAVRNVISGDYPGGQFDDPATAWVVQGNADVHSVPAIMPASVTGGLPKYLGATFSDQYRFGDCADLGPVTTTTGHIDASAGPPGCAGGAQRGTVTYNSQQCGFLASVGGVAALLAKEDAGLGACGDTNIMNVWGLAADGSVTGTLALPLPAVITDNSADPVTAAFHTNIAGANEFDNYHGSTAFRGGNGQVALGYDQDGNLLVAAMADHPLDLGDDSLNYIAVARVNCTTGVTEWTMAGYVDSTLGQFGTSKAVEDGAGNAIGRLVSKDVIPPTFDLELSMSSPMIDSVGNVYFLAPFEEFPPGGGASTFRRTALFRAILQPGSPLAYKLELMMRPGNIFAGQNSGLNYLVTFLALTTTTGATSPSGPFSQHMSESAHLNANPAALGTSDPRTLGGMVLSAGIIYDKNLDASYDSCLPRSGPPCGVFADLNGNGIVNTEDLLCVLDVIGGSPQAGCPTADIVGAGQSCGPDTFANADDLLALLNVIGGLVDCPDVPCLAPDEEYNVLLYIGATTP